MEITDINTEEPLVANGDPNNPTPPAGYKPLNPQQRSDWNGFLDYVKGQGNINLNDPQVGANFLNQYRQNNPNFSITPDQIPFIQYEGAQFRKGESFGNLTPDQLKYARAGLSPNFINSEIPEANGQFNAATSKLYYPQYSKGGVKYGTDIEGYANSLNGTPHAVNNVPEESAPTPVSPTVTGPNEPIKGTIPKPDYNNPQSRLNYAHEIVKQYGPLMQGRGDTFLKVNEVPETGTDTETPKQMTDTAASKLGIDPALLYASAMEEGMSGLWGNKKGEIDSSNDEKYPISGFVSFGLDNFSDAFPGLVKKGYLSKEFSNQFKKSVETNEKQDSVNSANFKTASAAMQAKAAMIRDAQDTTEQYAKANNITLSPKAKEFFTLVNYNAGDGNMKKMLKEYNRSGYLNGDKFLEKRPSDSWKGPYENVIRRIQAANALKKEGLWQDQ